MDRRMAEEEFEVQRALIQEKFRVICLASDGYYAQINVLMNFSLPLAIKHCKSMMFLKYASGASMTQSMNDQGHMHTIIHAVYKSASFLKLQNFPRPLVKSG